MAPSDHRDNAVTRHATKRPAPSTARRAAAVIALAAASVAVLYVMLAALDRWAVLVVGVISFAIVVLGAWYALSRSGVVRLLSTALAAAGLLAFVVVMIANDIVRVLAISGGLAVLSVVAAGYALRGTPGPSRGGAATRATHPVLLMNLKSGGGKAERFHLVEQCRQRGIEPIVLTPEADLLQLAEDALARGADLIGMAGGDGSHALAASVASRHNIPLVVVPAGTRNHFALDLGLDRNDVVGALNAYSEGFDRTIDLAEVNGRVFVNNASMGVYAKVVQSSEYRDAKMRTAAAVLPTVIGPNATPMDLRFTLPSGEEALTSQLILVSNNPYNLSDLRSGGTRAQMDSGVLGIVSLQVRSGAEAQKLAALESVGQGRRFGGWQEWTASEFEVRASDPVAIGVDGEALTMPPPLEFRIRPGALTVRLPRTAPDVSPGARVVRLASRSTLAALWHVARGRQPEPT
jgi:diacylglycerol kinase family enzyme